jgi:hypothetical protein
VDFACLRYRFAIHADSVMGVTRTGVPRHSQQPALSRIRIRDRHCLKSTWVTWKCYGLSVEVAGLGIRPEVTTRILAVGRLLAASASLGLDGRGARPHTIITLFNNV